MQFTATPFPDQLTASDFVSPATACLAAYLALAAAADGRRIDPAEFARERLIPDCVEQTFFTVVAGP